LKKPFQEFNSLPSVTLNNQRNTRLVFAANNKYRVGKNSIANRMRTLSNKLEKNWLELTKSAYKVCCKKQIIKQSLNIW